MIVERTHAIKEQHEVTKEELDEALFAMLHPETNGEWTNAYINDAEKLVKLAYENGYRLRLDS